MPVRVQREPRLDSTPGVDPSSPDGSEAICGTKEVGAIDETGILVGSTADEGNDFFGSCSGTAGPEFVASIELDDAVQDLAVSLSPQSFDPAI